MVFETKTVYEGTQQEITLKDEKKMKINRFNENLSIDDQKIEEVDKKTIEDQNGIRSSFPIYTFVQQTYIHDYVYVNADRRFMTDDEKKQFDSDWKNHWTPKMTEDTMKHEIKTVYEGTQHEITLNAEKKMKGEVSRSIKDQHGERLHRPMDDG